MSDRELLELAAKAARLDIYWPDYGNGSPYVRIPKTPASFRWNPLADEGAALRLAVNLGINLEIGEIGSGDVQAGKQDHWACEWLGADDPHAAVRRAIVRAAAALAEREGG